jgi:hypothetical protein
MGWKKASLEGSALGVLLSLLSMWLLGMPAGILLVAYALLLLLFSAYLTSSARDGALLGLFAVIGELAIDFIYSILVAGVLMPLVPYAVGLTLFYGRIAVFPLMGCMGGYLGQRYFAEKTKRRLRAKKRVGRERRGKDREKRVASGKLPQGSESSP